VWQPLPAGVTWTSPPLFVFAQTRAKLVACFGEPSLRDLDSNGLGSFDAWALRFACGLEVTLWIFERDPLQNPVGPEDLTNIEVHANSRDFDHIACHLPFAPADAARSMPDPMVDAPKRWRLLRQDDHGNRYEVDAYTSRCRAGAIATSFEERGHKQTYWIEGPDGRT